MWFAAVFISQVSEKIYGSVSVDTLLYEHVHYMCMSSESFFELKKYRPSRLYVNSGLLYSHSCWNILKGERNVILLLLLLESSHW